MFQLQSHHENVPKRCQLYLCCPQVSEGERDFMRSHFHRKWLLILWLSYKSICLRSK